MSDLAEWGNQLQAIVDSYGPVLPEPPVGTTVTLPTGRTFRRDDHHPDFHWRDGVGWYRWREVRHHAFRDDSVVSLPS